MGSSRALFVRTALLAVVAATLLVAACTSSSGSTAYSVIIPEGTWQESDNTVLDALPSESGVDSSGNAVLRLLFNKGDSLTVRNDDAVEHVIGLVAVRPGEEISYAFNQVGEFQGSCTLLGRQSVVLVVS